MPAFFRPLPSTWRRRRRPTHDHLADPARAMLGRFVVPVVRLREFDDAASRLLPRGEHSEPWHLSALPGPDLTADIDLALKFNCRHWSESEIGHAVIDALEIKACHC